MSIVDSPYCTALTSDENRLMRLRRVVVILTAPPTPATKMVIHPARMAALSVKSGDNFVP